MNNSVLYASTYPKHLKTFRNYTQSFNVYLFFSILILVLYVDDVIEQKINTCHVLIKIKCSMLLSYYFVFIMN